MSKMLGIPIPAHHKAHEGKGGEEGIPSAVGLGGAAGSAGDWRGKIKSQRL